MELSKVAEDLDGKGTPAEIQKKIKEVKRQMLDAASDLDFEKAARLRDDVLRLEDYLLKTQF